MEEGPVKTLVAEREDGGSSRSDSATVGSVVTLPEEGPVCHKVVRGEYLFKILRSHGLDEADAQVAMNVMAQDPRGRGITSGSVHVVYPGDTIRLPTRAEISLATAPLAAAPAPTPAAADPAPAPVTVSALLPVVSPPRVQAAREVLQDGSLSRLHELLNLVGPDKPLPSPRPADNFPVLPLGAATSVLTARPLARPGQPVLAGDMAPRLRTERPAAAVMRTARRPERPSVLHDWPRHGEPFHYQSTDEMFNLHRPYRADEPELWLGWHRCPGCLNTKSRLCIVVKLLSLSDIWDGAADDFDPESFEGFDTQV